MHELGVIIEVIKTVDRIVVKNQLTQVETIVLQIGELSSMIPKYIESCYPAAVDGTPYAQTKLEIEIMPGNVLCNSCKKVYRLIENHSKCPKCQSSQFEILSGKEFLIKEIKAR